MEADGILRGYHKPIMIAGGLGNINALHADKARSRRRHCSCSWAVRRC